MIKIIIDNKYYRNQFDDWLAGGKVEFKDKTYFWMARDSNYGFGWEIEPISETNWDDFSDKDFNEIIELINNCLYEQKNEFIFNSLKDSS
jgi:hypothetical protein